MLYEVITCFSSSALPCTLDLYSAVITSYSIHYTKLYDYDPDPVSWAVGGPSDTPFLPGDEVLWFVSNDLDPARTASLYGSSPVGLEVHTMVWASTGHPLLENVVFREYTIINKGVPTLENTYLGLWEDVDLGSPFDDLVGVDTTLGLQYDYNGTTRNNFV